MNCADAKYWIHLDVGDDLRAEEERQLAGHMERCPECRAYHAGMSGAMHALRTLRDTPCADAVPESVWVSVSREIIRRRAKPAANRRFNQRVALLGVCSLSLAMATIVQSLSAMRAASDVPDFTNLSDSNPWTQPQFSESRQFSGNVSWSRFNSSMQQLPLESGPQSF